jgi:hypothetical protein
VKEVGILAYSSDIGLYSPTGQSRKDLLCSQTSPQTGLTSRERRNAKGKILLLRIKSVNRGKAI